jgi:hypothetical protein
VYNDSEKLQVLRETPGRKDLIRFNRPDGHCGLAFAGSRSAWSSSAASRLSPCL